MSCEVCKEVGYKCLDCDIKEIDKKTWESLPIKDKVIATAYKRLILSDRKPDINLLNSVSDIYDKYPGFNIGIVP